MPGRLDLVILGGGAAGTEAALAARAQGLRVVLVEPGQRSGGHLEEVALAEELALHPLPETPGVRRADSYRAAVRRAGEVAATASDRRNRQLSEAGVLRLVGRGRLAGPQGRVSVTTVDGEEALEASRVLLATGSNQREPEGCALDDGVVSPRRTLLDAVEPPSSATVIGAGRAGVGLAGMLGSAGTVVTFIEARDRLLPLADEEVSAAVARALISTGVTLELGMRACAVTAGDEGTAVSIIPNTDPGAQAKVVEAAEVYAAVGREPDLSDCGLDAVGLSLALPLKEQTYATTLPWLYLAGSASGRGVSVEAATREGRAVVAEMMGKPQHVPYSAIPTLILGAGGCGWSGLSESQAKECGHTVVVGSAQVPGRGPVPPGFVKLVADRGSNRVLGVHVVGGRSRDAVTLGAAAVELGWSRLDLAAMAFPLGSGADALVQAAAKARQG